MVRDVEDVIIKTIARIMVPIMQVYSLYVYVHGHISPGGGFQGGCIMAASFILLAVAFNLGEAKRRLKEKAIAVFCSLGVFIYAWTGVVPLFFGGNFLDYSKWSHILPGGEVMARYYGMAFIELGVQIAVMAVMVSIFLDLVTAGRHEEVLGKDDDGFYSR
ncbi:MAG: Na(+)/H(+) antiporter subunit B [Syntrophorhabdaceae bacterium]|nr:Na(+)/H(+) antiporter subunit B [Syntrophorhabdaceae bacterium]